MPVRTPTTALVEIEVDEAKLRNVLQTLTSAKNRAPGVLRSAINRSSTYARREILNETTKQYGIKRPNIVDRVQLGPRAELARLSRTITVNRRSIGLVNFSAKQTPVGVVSTVRKGAVRVSRGAFIAVGAQGNRHVFRRKTRDRLPLKSVYGPSMTHIWNDSVGRVVQPRIDRFFRDAVRAGVQRELIKRSGVR